MKNKFLLSFILIISIICFTGCNNNNKSSDSKINSAIGRIETDYGNYYLMGKLGDFVDQLTNGYLKFESTNDISFKNLDVKGSKTSGNVYVKINNVNTNQLESFLNFDVRGENVETLLKDYDIESFSILNGIVALKNGYVTVGKTTLDDVISILGEENIESKNESLGVYRFILSDYEWKSYRFYYEKDNSITNIVVRKDY